MKAQLKDSQTSADADALSRVAFDPVVRAFIVMCSGFADAIYFARTPGAARHAALSGAHDAGYRALRYADLRVRRAPDFDKRTYLGKRPRTGMLPEFFDPL